MSVDFPTFGNPTRPTSASSFSLQVELPHFTRFPRVDAARSAVCRGRKPLIPSSAPASSGYLHAVIDFGQIRELDEPFVRLGVHDRADRHL